MDREDFVIAASDVREVQEEGKNKVNFRVQAVGRATAGQETEYDSGELSRLLANWETTPPNLSKVIKVGQILGETLFPHGLIRDAFLGSLAVHRNVDQSRLRIILSLEGVLHKIPWEFMLFHTEQGEATQNEILGLMSQVSIVRLLDRTIPDLKGLKTASLPAKMVMALADPRQSLDLQEERRLVEESLEKSKGVQITYVNPATAANLLGGLGEVHLFHFAGHGDFIERPTPGVPAGKGALLLDDGSGKESLLEAPQLARRLVNAGVRVAVLGACLTARRDEVNLWSSTAASLLNGGIGAVVAMQFTVRDESAIAFSKAFYEALALGFPVDQAVTKGRLAIFEQEDFRGFGTPVLYMGAGDGVVFPEFTRNPDMQRERENTRLVVNLSADIVEGKVIGIRVGKMKGGEAKATVHFIDLEEGAEGIGFTAGALTAGNVDVTVTAKKVKKGAILVGINAGEAAGGTAPPQASGGMSCPNCHTPAEPGWEFCIQCRSPLPGGPKS
jgi:hypothetical protein